MSASRVVVVALLALVAVVAFFAGRALRPGAAPTYAYDLSAPAYSAPPGIAAFSKGGFSGFGEVGGFDGATLLAGRITALRPDGIDIESAAGVKSTMRLAATPNILRILPADRADLRPGVSVVVRQDADASGAAVLVVSAP